MRRILFPLLFLGLVAGCSVPRIGPHRIDVQQGNALDQENVARLKIGLNRAQVRFLLGTPLVVDPFRTDRWDYVYLYYKSGQLTEQKRITLFFEGDTLARIEGDLPAAPPASEISASGAAGYAQTANTQVASAQAGALPAAATSKPVPAADKPVARETVFAESAAVRPAVPQPAGAPPPAVGPTAQSAATIVAPLPSPPNAPAYVDPRVKPEPPPGMIVETDVERIRPDVIPPFPDAQPAVLDDDAVLQAVDAWAKA
ncbi:MAG: outer membrane protein assembly factor BamE, partial [Thiobacillus sp.]